MFCSKCGKLVNDNSLFCMFCGQPVNETSPTDAQVQTAPAQTAPVEETVSPINAVQEAESQPAPAQLSAVAEGVGQINSVVTEPNSNIPKPEKYYTFGHLALCLAAVAVMAIVAGIFAGLYFSVK